MNPTFDIRDLRAFSGHALLPLLQAEADAWQRDLLWDYTPSIELLVRYLDSRILQGLVAVDRATAQPVGYTFSVFEGFKAVLGDVFALPGSGSLQIEEALVRSLVETLQHTPGVDRIESQVLLQPSGRLLPVFADCGFRQYPRLFMQMDPRHHTATPAVLELPANLRLMRWTTSHFHPAGELIHDSYLGHGDSVLNDQYHSIEGSLRFLHNIVRFPGCGVFNQEASWVIWNDVTSKMEALLLCSTVDVGVAHVTQICIAPHSRRQGLGAMLLARGIADLAANGFHAVTLTVTHANTGAVRLYTKLGFEERTTFDAMVWKR